MTNVDTNNIEVRWYCQKIIFELVKYVQTIWTNPCIAHTMNSVPIHLLLALYLWQQIFYSHSV